MKRFSFATRIAGLEARITCLNPGDAVKMSAWTAADLLACIREQQATLKRCVDVLQSQEALGKIGLPVTFECADNARATLEKWRLL